MMTKVQELSRNDPNISAEEVVRLLFFSDEEIDYIESSTAKQWQCEDWYAHKAGFITASKCKRLFTRQETLERNTSENVTKLVQAIALTQRGPTNCKQQSMKPQNAREWGLFHE